MIPRNATTQPEVIGLLDVGSAKVCCAIVERSWPAGLTAPPKVRVLGVGHQRSHGIKAGMVIDLGTAEAAVRAAVGQAERMADVTLEEVVATISSGRLKSAHLTAQVDLQSGFVTPDDLVRLTRAAHEYAAREGRELLHINSVSYVLDGDSGIREPLRLSGRKLGANWHIVTAEKRQMHNLAQLIDRCYLSVRQFVPGGLASALAATSLEERQLGVTSVTMGAGVFDIAAFREGQYLYADTIPIGGSHITYDIARILSTSLAEAERIKTLYGTLVRARSDEHELIAYVSAGERDGDGCQTTKAELCRAIYPRVDGQLTKLRERLVECDRCAGPGPNVVLTGGASQLIGLADLAAARLERPVRLAAAPALDGFPPSFDSPAFSALAGLAFVFGPLAAHRPRSASPVRVAQGGYLGRMEEWLRRSF